MIIQTFSLDYFGAVSLVKLQTRLAAYDVCVWAQKPVPVSQYSRETERESDRDREWETDEPEKVRKRQNGELLKQTPTVCQLFSRHG